MTGLNAKQQFHAQIMRMLDGLTDAERTESVLLHDGWDADGHYKVGTIVRRGESLYKCLIEHDAQPAWTPDVSPSLWSQIMYRDGIRIIPEVITATSAFVLDELGWWGDILYRSLIDNNVYTPESYPAGWRIEN